MNEVIVATIVKLVATLLMMLIGVLGTWLTAQIGKTKKLETVNTAKNEVIDAAMQTVEELQQVAVDGFKKANADGKLTKEEVTVLGEELLNRTLAKLSQPCKDVLTAAGVDIAALITGAGESWVLKLKE